VRHLIVDEPTRGVDVGTKAEFTSFSTSGLPGSDFAGDFLRLPEVMNLSRRILVMRNSQLPVNTTRRPARPI
jgi:ABC-type sugar transport system ATPase subunit